MSGEIGPVSPPRLIQILNGLGVPLNANLVAILAQLDVALSTRASEATVTEIWDQLDVELSTRASQATAAAILVQLMAILAKMDNPADPTVTDLFNVAKTANTPFFSENIDPFGKADTSCLIRVYVALSASAVLSLTRTRETATTTEKLNSGTPLSAGCAYIFDAAVSEGETINLVADADVTILKIAIFWVV